MAMTATLWQYSTYLYVGFGTDVSHLFMVSVVGMV
jgi:hypothetical protein